MKFTDLYKSVFAILRIEGTQARVAGTGFILNLNPLYILTCNHVVSEGNETNDGKVKYSITKRSDAVDEFDITTVEISFLATKKILFKPEFDLAILEVDPSINEEVANKLNLKEAKALELSFEKNDREFGSDVEWLSTAASSDFSLTPRFFKGNLITNYITNHGYTYKNNQGTDIQQIMEKVNLIEVDKLFIPGSSGSPILNVDSNKVVGYVHGFKSWPIPTNTEVTQNVEITENKSSKKIDIKYNLPLMTSLSLGIDVRAIEKYLKENNIISS